MTVSSVKASSAVAQTSQANTTPLAMGKKAVDTIVGHFPVIRSVEICVTSTALQALAVATIKNAAYITKAKELGINDLSHALTARANYLEAAAVSMAVFITNVAMALFFTVAAGLAYIVTLGKGSAHLNHAFKKHWIHAGLGAAGTGIGFVGAISPTLGAGAAGSLGALIGAQLYKKFTADLGNMGQKLIAEVQALFKAHRDQIVKWMEKMAVDNKLTAAEAADAVGFIERQIMSAKTVEDFKSDAFKNKMEELFKLVGERKKAAYGATASSSAQGTPKSVGDLADGKKGAAEVVVKGAAPAPRMAVAATV